jgi:hypothetical protein
VLSTMLMTEERTAASATGALAFGRPAAMPSTSMQVTAQHVANDRGYVCAIANDGFALHTSPANKAWAVRPLIPDGSGGG